MPRSAARALLFIALGVSLAAQTFPKPTGRINDFANVIDAATRAALDQRIDQVEQKTSSEIAVVTVTSLDGMSVEEYANKLFKEWGIGQAKQDNGVLVLVAPADRAMRIEVGYGLEGVLPDGLAGEIVRDDFLPRFRDNDYSGGIRNGVTRVADIVEKHQVLTPEELAKFNATNSGGEAPPYWIIVPFFGVFVTIGFSMVGIGVRTKTGFPLIFGGFFGGMPLLMSLAFIGKVSMYTLVPWAILMFLNGYRLGGKPSWESVFRDSDKDGDSSSGGWTMGSGSSSSSSGSSSSSSSSSSSFGGGSSGGGGASGRW